MRAHQLGRELLQYLLAALAALRVKIRVVPADGLKPEAPIFMGPEISKQKMC